MAIFHRQRNSALELHRILTRVRRAESENDKFHTRLEAKQALTFHPQLFDLYVDRLTERAAITYLIADSAQPIKMSAEGFIREYRRVLDARELGILGAPIRYFLPSLPSSTPS